MNARSRPSRPHVYLIQPKFPVSYWGMEHFLKLTPFDAVFPPLGLITLAALTPPEFQVTVCDQNAGETVDFDTDAEIVGITGYIIQIKQTLELADEFRKRGKKVLLGGPMANLLPEECRPHCDVLFQGEAEYIWPRFCKEYLAGNHADHYHETEKIHLPDSPAPRLDVLKRRYAHGIVQCTRGCPFTCEFCDIIVMYGRKMRFKPVEQVIQEIVAWKQLGSSQVFFADDNFIGNRQYAKDLLRAIAKWNSTQKAAMTFYTQVSVDMVRDEELLDLLRDANFVSVFIGIESPRKASLNETKKTQNEKLDLVEAIHKIQSHNLFISAGMIVGFDADDATIFEEQFKFLQEAGIPMAMLNVLMAIPKTPLHERLKREGRLHHADPTGLDRSQYTGTAGGTNFHPLNMTAEELKQGQGELYQRLYNYQAFADRLLGNLSRFKDVTYRPEPTKLRNLVILFRLAREYWKQGWKATKFFWSTLWKTARTSPRSIPQMVTLLGMYQHFCKVHGGKMNWDPWGTPKEQPVAQPAPTDTKRELVAG